MCRQYWGSIVTRKQTQAWPSDGIRSAYIVGLKQFWGTVALYFSKERSHQKLDQANNPDKALFEELSLKFDDPTVKVPTPPREVLHTMVLRDGINLRDIDPHGESVV